MLTQRAPYILAVGITLLAIAIIAVAVMTGGGGGKSKGTTNVSTSNATPVGTPVDTAPSTAGGPNGQPAAAGSPDIALANYVQTTFGKAFVTDCTKADPAKDAGKLCGTFKGDRATMKAYQIGPVGSAPSNWLIVDSAGSNTWNVVLNVALNPDTAAVPGVPWPLKIGVDLVVAGSNPCVNVRVGPSLGQAAVDCMKDGTKIQLAAGPTVSDNIQWWQVAGRQGWVSSDYLRYPDAAQ